MAKAHLAIPSAEQVPGCGPAGEQQDRDRNRQIVREDGRIGYADSEQHAQSNEMLCHTRFTVRPNRPSGRKSRISRNAINP